MFYLEWCICFDDRLEVWYATSGSRTFEVPRQGWRVRWGEVRWFSCEFRNCDSVVIWTLSMFRLIDRKDICRSILANIALRFTSDAFFLTSTACLLFSYVGLNFVTVAVRVNWIFLFDCRSVVLLFTTQPQKVTWTLHVSYSITRRTSTEKLRCEISSTQKFIGRTCSLNEFIPR